MVFELPLTREAMADYLGLTLETVSRQVSALKKDGVISLEGKRRPSTGRCPMSGCWQLRLGLTLK